MKPIVHNSGRAVAVALEVIVLCGCASIYSPPGPDLPDLMEHEGIRRGSLDPAKVAQLRKGVSTREQVISLFGAPESSTSSSDGTETLSYFFTGDTVDLSHLEMLCVTLDGTGKVLQWTTARSGDVASDRPADSPDKPAIPGTTPTMPYPRLDKGAVSKIVPGGTTQTEVEAILGKPEPSNTRVSPDGAKITTYFYYEAVSTGAEEQAGVLKSVQVACDRDGRVLAVWWE